MIVGMLKFLLRMCVAIRFVSMVCCTFVGVMEKSARSSALPRMYVGVGDTVLVGGHLYRCVLRPPVEWCGDACRGCDFSVKNRNCANVQCSRWDRRDELNVWFVEECLEKES